jgi:hypothetical protein
MDDGGQRKPLLVGRGLVPIEVFPRATGLDRATAEALVKEAKIEGALHLHGGVAGLFDDKLPTAERLRALGLNVSSDYNPAELCSHEDEGDDPHEPGPSDSKWTMSWDDPND